MRRDAEIDLERRPVSAALADEILDYVGDINGLAGLFMEAAKTERALPRPGRRSIKACWPDVPEDRDLAYGYNEVEVRPIPATAAEIKRYDWALALTPMMSEEGARVVWAASHSGWRRRRGPAWKSIGLILGCSRHTVKALYERALIELWYKMLYLH